LVSIVLGVWVVLATIFSGHKTAIIFFEAMPKIVYTALSHTLFRNYAPKLKQLLKRPQVTCCVTVESSVIV